MAAIAGLGVALGDAAESSPKIRQCFCLSVCSGSPKPLGCFFADPLSEGDRQPRGQKESSCVRRQGDGRPTILALQIKERLKQLPGQHARGSPARFAMLTSASSEKRETGRAAGR